MRRLLWAVLGVVGLGVLAAAGVAGWVWAGSEAHLRSFSDPPPFTTPIPTDGASLALGERIARTRGCYGCHSVRDQPFAGDVFHEGPGGFRAVAPNLTKLAREQSPAMLERAIRHGIGHDGRAFYSMPSYAFLRLTDADTAALIGYLRSLPLSDHTPPKGSLGWKIRLDLARGKDAASPAFEAKVGALTWQTHPDPAVRRGEYLARTTCTECHGFTLCGDNPFDPPGQAPPDLAMVASYEKADFIELMRTGVPPGGRDLRLMSMVARQNFSHFTDQELEDLYAFLKAMGEKAASEPAS